MVFLFYNKTLETGYKTSTTNALRREGYIILDHISNGSYGEVRHSKYITENSEQDLVVKIIDTHQTSKDYVTKFLPRELDILRKINHPYIIYTHSILQRKAVLFIFMAYAGKGELLQYVIKEGPLKENRARVWFRQLVLALQYLHTMDIVHRDIKCENILITNNFTMKLADFGFSRFVNRSKRLNCNTYCCSIAYAPPEVLNTRPYDGKASDIWSLGVVLYVMINKKMPFNDSNVKLMYKQQVKREWHYRSSVEQMISQEAKTCVYNMLQPEAKKRWTTDKILNSEWIKMNPKLITMNENETLALVEAMKINQTKHNQHLKKIDSNNTGTQQLLNKRPPKFESHTQSMLSVDVNELNSENKLSKVHSIRRSARVLNANKLLVDSDNSSKDIL
ncbi:testis-specific serine/threonine-protein kinase 2-like [Daktulosphaira vitifoliae]|uniref:testis-specific serine/threonine-protein kinase 2-like n=1 Tax=Daktulosphaira vitifoliae TaxID=58002 RepID=UPI0021AAE1BE|nr:testis-specific serine/threonine-protein kinase 2-like [Daktulosphaira vitifoliae]